jgi:hypothetical protein
MFVPSLLALSLWERVRERARQRSAHILRAERDILSSIRKPARVEFTLPSLRSAHCFLPTEYRSLAPQFPAVAFGGHSFLSLVLLSTCRLVTSGYLRHFLLVRWADLYYCVAALLFQGVQGSH